MEPTKAPATHFARRFLVTAGNTREKIDAVRDWGNIFTGNTGLAIARALARVGEVDLLTSNRGHLAEFAAATAGGVEGGGQSPIHPYPFTSHAELRAALAGLMGRHRYDAVFMTAAVADYRPRRVYEVVERRAEAGAEGAGREVWVVRDVQAAKVKSTHEAIAVLGARTEKLVDLFRTAWGFRGLLVKFKLEVGIGPDELLRVAEASRRASGADYLVANTLDMVEGRGAGAWLLGPGPAGGRDSHEWVPRGGLPERLVQLVQAVGR